MNGDATRGFDVAFEPLGMHDIPIRSAFLVRDGDTIEVRGNGPFVTEPIHIGDRALVIRAGTGFRPVIELSASGIQADEPLLDTRARLVLEGLELRRMGPPNHPVASYRWSMPAPAPTPSASSSSETLLDCKSLVCR